MKTSFRIICSLFAVIMAFSAAMFAQTPTGVIEGVVSDPQGNVVAGATVKITNTGTGNVIDLVSNDEGFYSVRSVLPGTYAVRVEKEGFSTASAEGVVVQIGLVARANITLQVGQTSEVVQVDIGATDVQVDTSRQTVDGIVTARQITELPLNARNFLDLAGLQPGVTVVDGGAIDPTKENTYRAVRVNGGSGTGTRIALEGIDVTDETVGSTVANFSTDAIQEFNLGRSSLDLSTSLTTSGAITVGTRSGSNKFSGSAFYFKQHERFDARPGFEAEKPEFNRDQEGFRFGGPFIKDRLFFFTNFERFNQANRASFTSGDFPSFDAVSTIPRKARYNLNRLDGQVTDEIRLLYIHSFNDDSSSAGTLISPFANVNWTNAHIVGANITTSSRFTHSIRFGYVNFNNRIQSEEFEEFPFLVVDGLAVQVNVGDLSWGPNTLAPQQTYQDNWQYKYDGSAVLGDHTLRYGAEANRITLGGFANFAGPTQVTGDFSSSTSTDPLAYNLQSFQVGPNSGFFTPNPAHGFPFGGRKGTRYAWFVGDQWKVRPNLSLNFGVRWTYDTSFFAGEGLGRIAELERFGTGFSEYPKFPKNAFSPQAGFAWDPFGKGKTSVRGGFSMAYDNNIFNNSLFDALARMPLGIGPTGFDQAEVLGPDGSPIVVFGIPGCANADVEQGNYSCMVDPNNPRTIAAALPHVVRINAALQTAYSNISFDPTATPNEFTLLNGSGEIVYHGDYKIPYSLHFNLGIQQEIARGHVLSVDYVRQRGIRTPIQLFDLEHRRDARFFNEAAARTSIGNRIGVAPGAVNPAAIATYLAANPSASITTFALANDVIWPGVSSLTNARVNLGGFSLYEGIQVSLIGRTQESFMERLSVGGKKLFSDFSYTLGYALSRNQSTSGIARPEFLASASNNRDLNADFGESALHQRQKLTISASVGIIGGFRLDQIYRFASAAPSNLRIPNNRGTSGIFTVDFNGDGGNGTAPRTDLLPGTNIGDFGTRINSWDELNEVLTNYNNTYAGQITPHGQRLVAAGIFSEAQLRSLGAVMPIIPLVPTSNPWPFQNLFVADYRLSRPIKIWKETWVLEPNFSVFNVFNNAAKGTYAGLAIPNLGQTAVTNFGALNYNYATEADLSRLNEVRGLRQGRRQLQFGIRFTF